MTEILICEPIGYYHGPQSEKYMAPRQAELAQESSSGLIILNPGRNFEQALEDLTGFEHIWILYWFNRNTAWKPKVTTPRNGPNRGLFATRSPHRPNPIGLSCVPLISVKGREIHMGRNDLLDDTPILDIKPYLAYADAFPDSKQGWVENAPKNHFQLQWSPLALDQARFIEAGLDFPLIETAELRLKDNPFPFKSHRIKKINGNEYVLAIKTWRLHYLVNNSIVDIRLVTSGYDQETLDGRKASRWDDVPFHQKFLLNFT